MDKVTDEICGDCRPIAEILDRIGDKWSLLLLDALGDRTMRFKDLHRALSGISQRMLTVTLRSLERDGLIVRRLYPTIPPKVEYSLSDQGRSLRSAVVPIMQWVAENRHALEAARHRFDACAGTEPAGL
jgi:DNA-binding HxlR family transcriptional regulator